MFVTFSFILGDIPFFKLLLYLFNLLFGVAIGIFKNTAYPIIGKTIGDIEMWKLIDIFLRIQVGMCSKEWQKGYKKNPEPHNLQLANSILGADTKPLIY